MKFPAASSEVSFCTQKPVSWQQSRRFSRATRNL